LLARRLYYGIVLLRLKQTQERRAEGTLHSTHRLVEAAFRETLTFAKTLSDERASSTELSIGVEKWPSVRWLLEASRARSAVHILSRAALSATRREELIETTSSESVTQSERDAFSIDPRLRSEIRLALFKRKVRMPLTTITRLRLLPLAEIVTSRPPVFIEERLDSVVRAVSQRLAESSVGQEKFASS
jgi:hypothetical protein